MRHVFLRRPCSWLVALQCRTFRLQQVIALLTRASTVIRVVNRAGVAHVSKETNYDAIIVYGPAGSITPLLLALSYLHHFTPLQRGNYLRSVQAMHTTSLAPSNGTSVSMMR